MQLLQRLVNSLEDFQRSYSNLQIHHAAIFSTASPSHQLLFLQALDQSGDGGHDLERSLGDLQRRERLALSAESAIRCTGMESACIGEAASRGDSFQSLVRRMFRIASCSVDPNGPCWRSSCWSLLVAIFDPPTKLKPARHCIIWPLLTCHVSPTEDPNSGRRRWQLSAALPVRIPGER